MTAQPASVRGVQVVTGFEQLFFTTAFVSAQGGGGSWIGTGFIYAVGGQDAHGNEGEFHFLVTNKHVLKGADQATFRMVRSDPATQQPMLGQAWQATVERFGPHVWWGHPDANVDVAVMPFSDVLNAMRKQMNADPFFRAIPNSMTLNAANVSQLDALEEVVFVGYPNGIYDQVNFLPVMRRGTTATPIAVDYEGLPAFLIDASVFAGSSGSPVFIAEKGSYAPRGGGLVVGDRVMFLGVVAAVHVSEETAKIEPIPTAKGSRATFELPLNLGIVFKATAIEDILDRKFAELGIRRLSSSGPPTPRASAPEEVANEQLPEAGSGSS